MRWSMNDLISRLSSFSFVASYAIHTWFTSTSSHRRSGCPFACINLLHSSERWIRSIREWTPGTGLKISLSHDGFYCFLHHILWMIHKWRDELKLFAFLHSNWFSQTEGLALLHDLIGQLLPVLELHTSCLFCVVNDCQRNHSYCTEWFYTVAEWNYDWHLDSLSSIIDWLSLSTGWEAVTCADLAC
jgi:hypothetical protein